MSYRSTQSLAIAEYISVVCALFLTRKNASVDDGDEPPSIGSSQPLLLVALRSTDSAPRIGKVEDYEIAPMSPKSVDGEILKDADAMCIARRACSAPCGRGLFRPIVDLTQSASRHGVPSRSLALRQAHGRGSEV